VIINPLIMRNFFFVKAVAKESDELLAEVTQYMEDALLWKAELVRMIKERSRGLEELKTIFREWDVNGDGEISRKELRLALKAMSITVTDQTFAKLLRAIDPDCSGSIDYDEFVHLIYPKARKQRLSGTPAEHHQHHHLHIFGDVNPLHAVKKATTNLHFSKSRSFLHKRRKSGTGKSAESHSESALVVANSGVHVSV
jgi:Ca2+-binding EF-hand superfamily protein